MASKDIKDSNNSNNTTSDAPTKSVKDLDNPQKDGFLHKLSNKKSLTANWKRRWFVLHGGILYYFKAVNSVKLSGMIPLSQYNRISDSGKSKRYSFKLETTTPNSPVYYICADSEEELTSWRREIIVSIKGGLMNLSRKSISFMSLLDNAKKLCTMYINVAEARNLPARDLLGKSDPYLIADAGGCQARTRTIYKSLSPFWGEEYSLNLAESFTKDPLASIKITVWDEDKFTKDNLIGQIVVPVSVLSDGKVHEQWYPLFPLDTNIYVSGNLHLRMDHDTKAKTLTVRVLEGRNLASKDANGLSDPYVKVFFAKSKKKTTIIKKTLNPFFNEGFVFDVPPSYYENSDSHHNVDDLIHVSCWDWDRLGSNEFMGEVAVRLHEMEPNVVHDAWCICADLLLPKGDLSKPVDNHSSLNLLAGASAPNSPKPLGEVRLKLKYTEDPALPSYIYQPLLNLFQSASGPTLALLMEQVVGPGERGDFAQALVAAMEMFGSSVYLLNSCATTEIMATTHHETIFRGNSLVTKGLDAFMKLVAMPYLEHVIGPTIKKIYASKKSCEVDPTREKEENIPNNFKRLLKLCNGILQDVLGSIPMCPVQLREIFNNLQVAVERKYGVDSPARYAAVSSFLFLRHICPAILNPKLFGLASDHPDQRTARVLTLLSKTIQNLANLVTFGQKEPYMLKMNEFIEANMSTMKTFLDQISTIELHPSSTPRKYSMHKTDDDKVRAAAALLRYVDRSINDLQNLLTTSIPQPKKDAINECLAVHAKIKQYRSNQR